MPFNHEGREEYEGEHEDGPGLPRVGCAAHTFPMACLPLTICIFGFTDNHRLFTIIFRVGWPATAL
jgi:hypothetical protein